MPDLKAASALGAQLAVLNGVVEKLGNTVSDGERTLRRRKEELLAEEGEMRARRELLAEAKKEAAALQAALHDGGKVWNSSPEELEAFVAQRLASFESIMSRFYASRSDSESTSAASDASTTAHNSLASTPQKPSLPRVVAAEEGADAATARPEEEAGAAEFSVGRDEPAPELFLRTVGRFYAPLSVLFLAAMLTIVGQDLAGILDTGFSPASLCPAPPAPKPRFSLFAREKTPPPAGCEFRVYMHGAVGLVGIFGGSFAAAACIFPRLVGGFGFRFCATIALQIALMGASYATRVWALGNGGVLQKTFESASARDTMSVAMVGVIGLLTVTLLRASQAATGAKKGLKGFEGSKDVVSKIKGLMC